MYLLLPVLCIRDPLLHMCTAFGVYSGTTACSAFPPLHCGDQTMLLNYRLLLEPYKFTIFQRLRFALQVPEDFFRPIFRINVFPCPCLCVLEVMTIQMNHFPSPLARPARLCWTTFWRYCFFLNN